MSLYIFDHLCDVAILQNLLSKKQLVLVLKDQVAMGDLREGRLDKEEPKFFDGVHASSHIQVGFLKLVEHILVLLWRAVKTEHCAFVLFAPALPKQIISANSACLLVSGPFC